MAFRQLPTAARRIGFSIEPPNEVELIPGEIVRCTEERDGETVGEMEVAVFSAALVIDRDGILEEKAHDALVKTAAPGVRVQPAHLIELDGASGYHLEAEFMPPRRPALPFVHVFALASNDLAIDGGIIVTIRSAAEQWPAAEAILKSLRILSRRPANE